MRYVLGSKVEWRSLGEIKKRFGIVKHGEEIIEYAAVDNINTQGAVLRYYDTGKHGFQELRVSLDTIIDGNEITRLWAKRNIQDLMKEKNSSEYIISLSLTHKIPCSLTVFTCIKETPVGKPSDIEFIEIPNDFLLLNNRRTVSFVETIINYCDQSEFNGSDCVDRGSIMLSSFMEEFTSTNHIEPDYDVCEGSSCEEIIEENDEDSIKIKKVTEESCLETDMMRIILGQSCEGFWKWEKIISLYPGLHSLDKQEEDIEKVRVIYATVFGLQYLQLKHNDTHGEWMLIEKKALGWLKKNSSNIEYIKQEVSTVILK